MDMLRTHFPMVHTLPMTDNKGFAGGYNFGLNQIEADCYPNCQLRH